MSVSGVPSIPGFDVLFPSGTYGTSTAASPATGTTPASGTSAAASPTTTPLGGTAASGTASTATATPAGFDVLFPSGTTPGTSATPAGGSSASSTGSGSSSATPSSGSSTATQNPYQQAYSSLETWSANYLAASVEGQTPSTLPEYSAGSSAGSMAQLMTTLAAIKPLIALDAGQTPGTSSSGSNSSGIDTTA